MELASADTRLTQSTERMHSAPNSTVIRQAENSGGLSGKGERS